MPASAQGAGAGGGVAQSLFEEGVRLMREKKYAEACPKLAESHRLEPGGGTILNLAICLEEDGKLASAYVAYDEALARAKKDNNTKRVQTVEGRMAALKPKLSRVTITVAKPNEGDPKPDVRFDGTALGEQAWGVPFYADVGTHAITAEAPGYKSFRSELRVEAAGKPYEMNVPALEKDPNAAVASTSPTPAPATPDKSQPAANPTKAEVTTADVTPSRGALPWILVGTSAVLLGTGAVTGVLAFSKHSDSDAECPDGKCTAKGADAESQANTFAWIANITIPLGVIAGAAGAYLFIKSPAKVAPTASGLVVYGAF
jgi:hypothetical protein